MAMRELNVDGSDWIVWDVVPGLASGQRALDDMPTAWLALQCDTQKHRVLDVPEGWSLWPDEQLADLVRSTERLQSLPATPPDAPAASS